MQKWEYCAIVGIARSFGKSAPILPALWNFKLEGLEEVKIKDNQATEVAKTIAQLGEQGWEMLGTGSTGEGSVHILYFKRPKD